MRMHECSKCGGLEFIDRPHSEIGCPEALEFPLNPPTLYPRGVIHKSLGVHRVDANPTWRTPSKVFSELDAEFDFTLDPAASAPIKPGIRWFGEDDQGLWQEWSGRVFVNPPYGRAIQDWMRKISLERSRCEVIVALVPARTDTEWWHEHAMPADEIRFIRGRLNFEGVDAPKGHNAPFPSVVLVFQGGVYETLLHAGFRL